jgi:UDP-N-acetylmuramoyl-L-alanyl-D-glutamate--2,6-diaminopimelate ligase
MRKLIDILNDISILQYYGTRDILVQSIVFDSRAVKEGALFVAQKGTAFDGHLFIDKAISLGASAIVCEDLPSSLVEGITYLKVENSDYALAHIASSFYDNPSSKLKLVGITGTNGKTTIASLLYDLFKKSGFKSGLLSTVKIRVGEKEYDATHTTPDSVAVNSYLREMVDAGITHCFMEVSSHGIHQHRIEGLSFDGGVFTNLSHDHLDDHKTFAEYRDVKKKFFDGLSKDAFALTNADDKNGSFLLQNTKATKISYAQKTIADYRAKIIEKSFSGMLLQIDDKEVWVRLIGEFNVSNLLAIYAVGITLGLDRNNVLVLLSQLESVNGRFQYAVSKTGIVTIVDYAHTPDALRNVLSTIEGIRSNDENLISVVGCGGDRDSSKRGKMGGIAASMSDQVVFTSDNPRFEEPQAIIDEIELGVSTENQKKTLSILDRKQAIKTALKLASSGDIVLVAGKGHEDYQDILGVKHHFDDKEIIQEILKSLDK